jgi:hypothetical protein
MGESLIFVVGYVKTMIGKGLEKLLQQPGMN